MADLRKVDVDAHVNQVMKAADAASKMIGDAAREAINAIIEVASVQAELPKNADGLFAQAAVALVKNVGFGRTAGTADHLHQCVVTFKLEDRQYNVTLLDEDTHAAIKTKVKTSAEDKYHVLLFLVPARAGSVR